MKGPFNTRSILLPAMALLLASTLLAAQPQSEPEGRQRAAEKGRGHINVLEKFTRGPMVARTNPDTGAVTTLRGRFQAPGQSPEEAGRAFLARHAVPSHLGVGRPSPLITHSEPGTTSSRTR